MHDQIKNILPTIVLEKLKGIRNYRRRFYVFRKDKQRFLTYYSKKNTIKKEELKSQLLFYSHSIEKGLSRENLRYGFGKGAISKLSGLLKTYQAYNYDSNDTAYLIALSVLNKYICLHEKQNYSIDHIVDVNEFKTKYMKEKDSDFGGIKNIQSNAYEKNKMKNFKELAENRHSVRDYGKEPVDLQKINEAIKIATKSPSVCNRQSTRVRIINNKKIIQQALKVQGGFNGYNDSPCLLVVTTDTRYFMDITERNQMYIDGGLFAMSLLYALEYEGLAACALNTMFDPKREHLTRNLLNICENENLIMYISVGNFKKEYKVPKSHRLNVSEIVTSIE